MKKLVTQILFVLLFVLGSSSTLLAAIEDLRTNNLPPKTICQGDSLRFEFVSTIDMSSINSLKVKFLVSGVVKDSVNVSTTFDTNQFKDTQWVQVPPTIYGNNVTARAEFIHDSSATWHFFQSSADTVNPYPVVSNQAFSVCSDVANAVNFGAATIITAATYNLISLNLNGLTVSAGSPGVANGLTSTDLADDAFTNTTTSQVVVTYTVVPVSLVGCKGNSFTVRDTVKPEPVVANQQFSVCSDVASGVNFGLSSGVTASTYNLNALNLNGLSVNAGSPAIANGLTSTDLADDAFTNTTTSQVVVTYTVVPVSLVGCKGNSFIVRDTVKPEPVVANQQFSVCSDVASGVNFGLSSGVTASTYNLNALNLNGLSVNAGSPAIANGLTSTDLADDAFTNTTTSQVVVTYTVVPVSLVGCKGNSFIVRDTVKPEPVVANQQFSVCSDVASGVNFGLSSGVTASTYNLNALNLNGLSVNAGSPAIANGLTNTTLADDAFTNTTSSLVVVTYTVVPVSGAGCLGNSFLVQDTVKPEPVVANQLFSVCSDVASGMNFGSSTSVTVSTYNLTSLNLNGLTASAGSPTVMDSLSDTALANDAFTNTTNSLVVVAYTVVPVSAAGCLGNSFSVQDTVKPEPIVTLTMDTICSGQALTLLLSTDTSHLCKWGTISPDSVLISTNSTNNFSYFSPILTNQSAVNPKDITLYIIPKSKLECIGDSVLKTVTVNPSPRLSVTNLNEICSGAQTEFSVTAIPAASTFTWSTSNTGVTGQVDNSSPQTIFNPQSLTNTSHSDTNTVSYNFTVKSDSGGCTNTSIIVNQIVKPIPIMNGSSISPANICSGDSNVNISYTPSTNVISIFKIDSLINLVGFGISSGKGVGHSDTINSATILASLKNNTDGLDTGLNGKLVYVVEMNASGCTNKDTIDVIVHPLPNLNVTSSISPICSGNTAIIKLTSSTNDTTFTWLHSADSVIGGQNNNLLSFANDTISYQLVNTDPSHQNEGRDTFFVTPISKYGCQGPDSAIIQRVYPTPKLNNLTNDSICSGDSIHQINLSSLVSTPSIFKWGVSNSTSGLTISPASDTTFTIQQHVVDVDHSSSKLYTDTILITSIAGGCPSKDSFKVRVHPIPKFQLSSSTPTCSGDTTKILISSTVNSSIDTFKWSVISATSNVIGQDSGKGLQFIPQILTSTNDHDTESVQYKFKVTSQFGCYLTDTSDVIIWQRVNPTPKLASSLISICAQQSINFTPKNTDSSLGGAIFKWKLLKDDFSNKYSILKDSSISTNILGTIFDLATKDSIFNSLPSLDTLTYLYTIINSNTTCKNTQTDAVSGDSLFVDVKPQPNLFYGITPIDVVGANCINTGHRLFKLGRESIDTFEHFVWSWDTWNSTKDSGIYKAETNLNRVMIKTDTTRDVFLASNFTGNYGGCLQKDKFQIKDTTFSTWTKKDPRLILKKYARNGVTDIVLILLANDLSNPKINSSFKYRWGRINKETLVSEVFDDEHGQEYLFQSNKSDDTLTFFYWAEVKMQNDECIRRIYLNDKLLNMKAITQDPAESKEFSVKVYPNPAGNLLNIKLEGLDNLQEVKMELYDLTGQLVKSIDMKSDMLSVPIGHLTKGMYLVTCKQNGVQISSQKLIKE